MFLHWIAAGWRCSGAVSVARQIDCKETETAQRRFRGRVVECWRCKRRRCGAGGKVQAPGADGVGRGKVDKCRGRGRGKGKKAGAGPAT